MSQFFLFFVVLIVTFICAINFATAISEQLPISCGGNDQIIIGCLDNVSMFIGSALPGGPSGGGGGWDCSGAIDKNACCRTQLFNGTSYNYFWNTTSSMCGATPITPPKKVSNFLTRLLSIIMGLFSVVPMSDETAQSIGENSVLIFLIIVIFVSILIFLIYKRRKEKEKKKRQEKSKNKP